ncbi:MAG: hypothetical protein ABGW66_05985 [Flavobacteriaceae bacterium]|jgi:hypothetical protein
MATLSDLKSRMNIGNLTSEINKIADRDKSFSNNNDNTWRPKLDKSSNGFAVIRFLPTPSDDGANALPWCKMYDHGFKTPNGSWYIEKSLTTLGEKDPLSEWNSKLWNSGIESNKDVVRNQKRRLNYYANIYVEQDPQNPDNEGKVFLYRFGKKIFDMINEAMQPEFADEDPINPFDMIGGASFKMKIRQVEGYWNYDKSGFATPSPLVTSEDEMVDIWNKCYSLKDMVDPSNFKSYEELEKKLIDGGVIIRETVAAPVAPAPVHVVAPVAPSVAPEPISESSDDAMSYFKKLANS